MTNARLQRYKTNDYREREREECMKEANNK